MERESWDCMNGFCTETHSSPANVVIFGASGDLTKRKLIPALFNLYKKNLMDRSTHIIGCSRTQLNDNSFRNKMSSELISSGVADEKDPDFLDFISKLFYISGEYKNFATYETLSNKLLSLENESSIIPARVFYLSTPANLYEPIVECLGACGLVNEPNRGTNLRRVVIEKPFGFNRDSAHHLDQSFGKVLTEEQTYRIDHYLGKETVQNILMLRFANMIFEPIWNNRYIDHVQITAAESIGVEHRAGYYEQSGLVRDMFQNHMLQMLCLVAMEPPYSFEADAIRNEKVKVLRSIREWPLAELDDYFVRAQYSEGAPGSGQKAYRDEDNVDKESTIETYAATKLFIDNWRWKGIPFYVRSGKSLKQRVSEIVITFKQIPHSIFGQMHERQLAPNQLILNVQPQEGVSIKFNAKQPGPKLCLGNLMMDFKYADVFGGKTGDAYERLLLDSMIGDQTLFIRSDFIEAAWGLLDPVLNEWKRRGKEGLGYYPCGSWGPVEADRMLSKDGVVWRNPES